MTLYLDTSAAIRAVVERGASPDIEEAIDRADALVCSRLALVECARVFHRLRSEAERSVAELVDYERELGELWERAEIWELTKAVCARAAEIAPRSRLRALDALHLATFQLARRRITDLELLTADERLRQAARAS